VMGRGAVWVYGLAFRGSYVHPHNSEDDGDMSSGDDDADGTNDQRACLL